MNAKFIIYLLGKISAGLAIAQLLPLLMSVVYGEYATSRTFIFSIAVAVILAGIFDYYGDGRGARNLSVREGIGTVFFSWLLAAGATAIANLDIVSRSLLLWRTLTHWIGGIGIIVLFVALLPQIAGGAVYLFNAEVSGFSNSRILPRIRTTAVALFYIYLLFTIILTGMLAILGMSTYDAVNHACSAIATGGFSTYNDSIAHFHSAGIEIVTGLFMILAAGNFALYYQVTQIGLKVLWHDLEFKSYIVLLTIFTVLISINIIMVNGYSVADGVREAFFQVASFGSTTGYVSADYDQWPSFSKLILAVTFLTGGCAGSTAGGIKVCRFIVLLKTVMAELRRTMHPQMLLNVYYAKRRLPTETIINVSRFFFVYVLVIAILTMLLCLSGVDVDEAVFGVASCISSVGPAFGSIGATGNYAGVTGMGQLTLALAMLLGRLELFTVLALLRGEYWLSSKRW